MSKVNIDVAKQGTSEDILAKLTSVQQSIISGFATLFGSSAIFVADGEFIVPEGIYEITVYACAAGGVVYAGEYVIAHKISVTPNERIPIVVGNAQTEIGEYLYLTEANNSTSNNADCLGIDVTLGIKGGDGSITNYSNASSIQTAALGGFGGGFGFGGGGGAAGKIHKNSNDIDYCASAGTAHTTTHNIYMDGVLIIFNGADNGATYSDYNGGNGGDAGGFGAGAGKGGSTGGYKPSVEDLYAEGSKGADGKGSQGLVIIKWGV